MVVLEFFKMIYSWSFAVNAVGTVLGFGFAFHWYKPVKDSHWFAKVFVALLLSWGFVSLVFLGRVCWEILNNAPYPTLAELKRAMQ